MSLCRSYTAVITIIFALYLCNHSVNGSAQSNTPNAAIPDIAQLSLQRQTLADSIHSKPYSAWSAHIHPKTLTNSKGICFFNTAIQLIANSHPEIAGYFTSIQFKQKLILLDLDDATNRALFHCARKLNRLFELIHSASSDTQIDATSVADSIGSALTYLRVAGLDFPYNDPLLLAAYSKLEPGGDPRMVAIHIRTIIGQIYQRIGQSREFADWFDTEFPFQITQIPMDPQQTSFAFLQDVAAAIKQWSEASTPHDQRCGLFQFERASLLTRGVSIGDMSFFIEQLERINMDLTGFSIVFSDSHQSLLQREKEAAQFEREKQESQRWREDTGDVGIEERGEEEIRRMKREFARQREQRMRESQERIGSINQRLSELNAQRAALYREGARFGMKRDAETERDLQEHLDPFQKGYSARLQHAIAAVKYQGHWILLDDTRLKADQSGTLSISEVAETAALYGCRRMACYAKREPFVDQVVVCKK